MIEYQDYSEIPVKIELYKNDIYFKESLRDAMEIFGDSVTNKLNEVSSIILKPESFISGKASNALAFLEENGFTPISYEKFRFNRNLVRDLWRYQLNAATPERLKILDIRSETVDVLFIVLKGNKKFDKNQSVSNEITYIKGHSNPIHHKKGELRHYLGQNIIMLNHVHSADETADLIRDMGVIFDQDKRIKIFNDIKNSNPMYDKTYKVISEIESQVENFPVTFENAINVINVELECISDIKQFGEIIPKIKNDLLNLNNGIEIDMLSFFDLIDSLNLPHSTRLKIIIGAKYAKLVEKNGGGMIPSIIGYRAVKNRKI